MAPRERPAESAEGSPQISVIVANYRGGRHIGKALWSILNQTVREIEVLVVDDASPDESVAVVKRIMAIDRRVILIACARNGGPARARNLALAQARGEWVAIVDSDDVIHPERFERLLSAADYFGADVIADDLLCFREDGGPVETLLDGPISRAPFEVTAELLIGGGAQARSAGPLGYLKPLIRVSALAGAQYDEALKIGEDYDLVLRLLLDGARYYVVPEPWYLYRRHSGSISHRLSVPAVEAMLAAHARMLTRTGPFPDAVVNALARRERSLRVRLAYERLVAALKAGDRLAAVGELLAEPRVAAMLGRAVVERLASHRRGSNEEEWTASSAPGAQRQIVLTENTAPSAAPPDAVLEVVPSYLPPSQELWSGAAQRETWRRVASFGLDRSVRVTWRDAGGAYAAGFMPRLWDERSASLALAPGEVS